MLVCSWICHWWTPGHRGRVLKRSRLSSLNASGSCTSKKEAEQDAARTFLKMHAPGLKFPPGIELRFNFDVQKAANSLLGLPDQSCIEPLALHLDLPRWAVSLLRLAFVHRSNGALNVAGKLGKDNGILAFLGSNVIGWLAYGAILDALSPSLIVKNGGIGTLVRLLVSEASTQEAARLFFQSWQCRLISPSGRDLERLAGPLVEALQAVVGVLYLAREGGAVEAKDLLHSPRPPRG